MGKCTQKQKSPKSVGGVAEMETPGVLTRARSKALQLKLRNRLVVRTPIIPKRRKSRVNCCKSRNVRMGRLDQNSLNSVVGNIGAAGTIGEGVGARFQVEVDQNAPEPVVRIGEEGAIVEGVGGLMAEDQVVQRAEMGVDDQKALEPEVVTEVSQIVGTVGMDNNAPEPEVRIGAGGVVGENPLAEPEMDRGVRESTPPHLIRDPTILVPPPPPGRRPRHPARVRRQPRGPVVITTNFSHLDASIGELQATDRQRCIERYNFDPLTEVPLPGRFEWEKVDPVP